MSDLTIAIRHIDELLSKGQTWENMYMSKLARLGWLRSYVDGLPEEEQKDYEVEISLLHNVISYLRSKKGE